MLFGSAGYRSSVTHHLWQYVMCCWHVSWLETEMLSLAFQLDELTRDCLSPHWLTLRNCWMQGHVYAAWRHSRAVKEQKWLALHCGFSSFKTLFVHFRRSETEGSVTSTLVEILGPELSCKPWRLGDSVWPNGRWPMGTPSFLFFLTMFSDIRLNTWWGQVLLVTEPRTSKASNTVIQGVWESCTSTVTWRSIHSL